MSIRKNIAQDSIATIRQKYSDSSATDPRLVARTEQMPCSSIVRRQSETGS
jgi:hypothetical protein